MNIKMRSTVDSLPHIHITGEKVAPASSESKSDKSSFPSDLPECTIIASTPFLALGSDSFGNITDGSFATTTDVTIADTTIDVTPICTADATAPTTTDDLFDFNLETFADNTSIFGTDTAVESSLYITDNTAESISIPVDSSSDLFGITADDETYGLDEIEEEVPELKDDAID